MQKIKLPGWTPELRQASRWMIGNVQFNVSLSSIAAINEMLNASAVLRDHPDVFRYKLKRDVNEAIRKGERIKMLFIHYSSRPELMDEFMDNIADVTDKDVSELRNLVRQAMTDKGMPEPELIAWVETARLLLHLAVHHYDHVMQVGLTRFKRDYTRIMSPLRMNNVLAAWDLVGNAIDRDPNIAAADNIIDKLKDISQKYARGKYLRECIALKKDDPYFASLTVEED